jgi:hypothetical protein
MLKIVTTATKIIQEHDIVYAGDGYFKSKENGIITYNYLYKWLKKEQSEMCFKSNFKKLIEQITFELMM